MSFFRSPGNSQVQTPQYTGVQMQASSSALPIPIVWGTTLVAPNVVWSGDFYAQPQYSQSSGGKGGLFGGGGGGSQVTGYLYFSALVLGLCEGPITSVQWGYDGQNTYSLYQLNCSVITGSTPQTPWSYLSARHPDRALAYPGTALVVSPSFDLGSSASVSSLSFEAVGPFAGSSVNANDADPAQIVFDFLTNAQYGVGFPAASIDATALYGLSGGSYQAYCAAVGVGLSPALTDQEAANTILARWLQLTNSTAVWSGGRLKIVPFGDAPIGGTLNSGSTASFVPNGTPVYDLTDDDFIAGTDSDPVVVTRSDPYSVPNVVNLEVLSRAPIAASGQVSAQPNYYAPTPIQARDQNAIESYGLRIGSTVTAHEICTTGIGQIAAQLILQRALYVRNTYAFKLSWECCLLEPMDLVTLSDANLGLAKAPVRILEIAEDGDGLLSVTAEEYPGAVGTTPGYAVDASTNEGTVSRSVAPAPVNAPILFEPPSDLTGGVAQLRIGASGGTNGIADPNWGGAAIYASTDNVTYTQIGAASQSSRMGTLTVALGVPPGSGSDTLQVSLAESGATIVAASTPTLILVGAEIMSFASATLTGTNAYKLGGLSRALYGQQGGAHAVGAPVLVLDASVFTWAVPQSLVGIRLWVKLASFNIFGATPQDLSTCVAYPVTLVGSGVFGPVSLAIAAGTSFDEGVAAAAVTQSDDDGLASDPYTRTLDMGLASEAAAALAVQSGGTGAASPAAARQNIGAAASGVNADISSLTALTAATIGKSKSGDTAALSYLSGGTTRASAGLLASDRYRVSVSAAGSSFAQALDIDPTTGHVGVAGYTADANNALGVLGTACLFAASTDSMRFTFSKVASANDATLAFQTNFSARALLGTTGTDQFQLKVSPDGASYYQVVVCDQTNGNALFKALVGLASYTVATLPSAAFNGAFAFASNGRKPTEAAGGGTGVVAAYSNGAWRRLSDESVVAS